MMKNKKYITIYTCMVSTILGMESSDEFSEMTSRTPSTGTGLYDGSMIKSQNIESSLAKDYEFLKEFAYEGVDVSKECTQWRAPTVYMGFCKTDHSNPQLKQTTQVNLTPDLTLTQMANYLDYACGIGVHKSTAIVKQIEELASDQRQKSAKKILSSAVEKIKSALRNVIINTEETKNENERLKNENERLKYEKNKVTFSSTKKFSFISEHNPNIVNRSERDRYSSRTMSGGHGNEDIINHRLNFYKNYEFANYIANPTYSISDEGCDILSLFNQFDNEGTLKMSRIQMLGQQVRQSTKIAPQGFYNFTTGTKNVGVVFEDTVGLGSMNSCLIIEYSSAYFQSKLAQQIGFFVDHEKRAVFDSSAAAKMIELFFENITYSFDKSDSLNSVNQIFGSVIKYLIDTDYSYVEKKFKSLMYVGNYTEQTGYEVNYEDETVQVPFFDLVNNSTFKVLQVINGDSMMFTICLGSRSDLNSVYPSPRYIVTPCLFEHHAENDDYSPNASPIKNYS